jgi:hypothetical protein
MPADVHANTERWAWSRFLLARRSIAPRRDLSIFARNLRAPIDICASARDMKRVVLNRKNSLLDGSERDGDPATILSSLRATCKPHGLDPQLYPTQAVKKVPHASGPDPERWLPDRRKVWQAHRVNRLDG